MRVSYFGYLRHTLARVRRFLRSRGATQCEQSVRDFGRDPRTWSSHHRRNLYLDVADRLQLVAPSEIARSEDN